MQSFLIEPGRATVMAPGLEDHTNLWYLRIKARAEDGFLSQLSHMKRVKMESRI